MSGTLETVDGRPVLRFERHLAHPVERVWRAVSEPAELERWFVVPVPWTPAAGEVFEVGGARGEITALEVERVLEWTFGGERYRFDLAPEGDDRCVLVFTHVLKDRSGGAQFAAGWEVYLKRLDASLTGGFLSEEEAHVGWAEVHASYVAAFGGDMTLEPGPVLRLERRYPLPPERVWRAITDEDELRHWFPNGGDGWEVTEEDPPRLLAGRWYGDELRFELRPDDDGCVLVLTHAFEDRGTAARSAAGWDRCFARFAAVLAGDPMGEAESLARWLEVHDAYAEAFGVAPELGRRAFAEHPLT